MAKLFPFEKIFRIILDVYNVEVPYGFCYDNVFDTIEFSYVINNMNSNVKYEFISFNDINYCSYFITVGRRIYAGLIEASDFTVISCLFNKFLKCNKII